MWKILLATDGSEHALEAARFLGMLPLLSGTTVKLVCALDPRIEGMLAVVRREEQDWVDRVIHDTAAPLTREGVVIRAARRVGEPAHEIINAARAAEADLVVVGSRGLSGLEGFLLGSVACNVAKHAGRPVLVGRAPKHDLRQAVLAVDGSEHALRAAEFTGRLPLPDNTETVVVNVVRPYNPYPGLVPDDPVWFRRELKAEQQRRRRVGEECVATARERLEAAGKRAAAVVREGDPATEILKVAEEREADLIVSGARGASLIQGLVVGSVADRLLKAVPCSLLVVH